MIEKIALDRKGLDYSSSIKSTFDRILILAEKINEIIDVINSLPVTELRLADKKFANYVKNNSDSLFDAIKEDLNKDP